MDRYPNTYKGGWNACEDHMTQQINKLTARNAKLEAVMAALIPFMEIALGAEGDAFGLQHNDATDALLSADQLLRNR